MVQWLWRCLRQVISPTGAGINYSVYAGQSAGRIAAESFQNGNIDYNHLLKYEKIFSEDLGKQQLRSFALKTLLIKKSMRMHLDTHRRIAFKKDFKKNRILEVFLRTFASNSLLFLRRFFFLNNYRIFLILLKKYKYG